MPTTFDAVTNLGTSTVTTAPAPATTGVSLGVTGGHGSRFPVAPFTALIHPPGVPPNRDNAELVRVTSKGTGENWTMIRAQGGTVARAVLLGDTVTEVITAEMLASIHAAIVTAETDIDALQAAATGSTVVSIAANDTPSSLKSSATYVCDGTADQVQIQQALDALPVGGGKIVLLPGNFSITAPIVVRTDSTLLEGSGVGQRGGATQQGVGTRITVASGFAGAAALVVARDAGDRPVYGVNLRDFTVDGATLGTDVDGILFRSNRGHIEHVHVHRMTGDGIHISGIVSPAWDTYDTHLAFVQVGDCVGAGVRQGNDSADGHLVSCVLFNNGDNWVNDGGASQQITACHFYDAIRYNLFFNGSGSRSKVSNCKIEGAGQHGIMIDSTLGGYADLQFTGNNLSTNGDSANNTYDHIHIAGPAGIGVTRTLVVGNSFSWKSGVANKPRYGFNAGSASQNALVAANTFGSVSHFGTAPVGGLGSGSAPAKVVDNIGYTSVEDLTPPPAVPMFIAWPGTSWPARSTVTSDTARLVIWTGGSTQPAGMATGDLWIH